MKHAECICSKPGMVGCRLKHSLIVFSLSPRVGALVLFSIKQHMKETGQFFTVLPVKAGNKQTKEQRIRLISPYFQSGNVFIRESMNEFVNEYKEFPLGKHDDLIDAFSYFPRCVRFMYNDPEPEPNNRIEEDYDFQLMLQGRSRTTGY